MNTYRTVSVGRGAFELCLPSLGNFYQITTLRVLFWASVNHMTKVGHGVGGRGSATICREDLIGISCKASSRLWCMMLSL